MIISARGLCIIRVICELHFVNCKLNRILLQLLNVKHDEVQRVTWWVRQQ